VKTAAIISKPGKPELAATIPELLRWFALRGYLVYIDRETAAYYGAANVVARSEIAQHNPEFVLVLGGDGTLISAARAIGSSEIPLLAVNLGSLGFLTEVRLDELYDALTAVVEGRSAIESRTKLDCSVVRDGMQIAHYQALNDVVVKNTIARLISYELSIDEERVVEYQADGIIIATPTGSTAYSLAAGGPVMIPTVDAILLTPICPHSLTHRPLVVGDHSVVSVRLNRGADGMLSVDGQVGMPVVHGDQVVCRKASSRVRLFRMQRPFFDVLRNKLWWGQR
jgi:NAD+ kinase